MKPSRRHHIPMYINPTMIDMAQQQSMYSWHAGVRPGWRQASASIPGTDA
eukprot:SAG31_NODE_26879_length_435_cov_0.595238_1_plen_49_part_10